MRGAAVDVLRAEPLERVHRFDHRPRRVDHVVGDEAVLPRHLADHVHDLGDVGRRPALVDDRDGRVQPLGEPARHLGRADVGCDHHQILERLLPVVVHERRRGVQVIDRQVEEPLELVLVKVHRQHAVGSGHRDHVRQQLGADRDPRLLLAVLPGVAEVRDHGRDPRRARAPGRVHQEQQLHDVFRGRVRGLDDEDIPPAHVLVDLDEDLAVREPADRHLAERLTEMRRHLFREGAVAGAAHEEHLAPSLRKIRHTRARKTSCRVWT